MAELTDKSVIYNGDTTADNFVCHDSHKHMITFNKIEHPQPIDFRWLELKTGEKVLQACYYWTQGNAAGKTWREIETVTEE